MKLRKTIKWRPKLETLEARRLLSVYGDFNGDGFDDLAIGVPGEDDAAGMVNVLYGSETGLSASGSQGWTEAALGTDSKEGDRFGASLAAGDFDGDGFSDLAIGIPGEDFGTIVDAGAVHIVLGSATGTTDVGNYVLRQGIVHRVPGIASSGNSFGRALAAGDFNDDGFADLAVGAPAQDIPGKADVGAVNVFYGGKAALSLGRKGMFHLDSPGVAGTATAGDGYGSALVTGDFNGDGRDDLAVGAPSYDISGSPDSGVVGVIRGSATGLTATGSQTVTSAEPGRELGTALASGDFDNDGFDDIVAGGPLGNAGGQLDAGEIITFEGSVTGLSFGQQFQQGNFGDAIEADDHFGAALAAGDFNKDGFIDVAIGTPDEETTGNANVGQVILAFGGASGLGPTGSSIVTQTTFGDPAETDDHFGELLSAGDFDGNGSADLVIGTPDEDIGSRVDAGAVYVLHVTAGPSPQTWNQDDLGESVDPGDGFGGGLDAGGGRSSNGDSSGRPDLAHFISANIDLDLLLTQTNKRRFLKGRR